MEKLSKDPEFNEVLDTDMNFIIRQYIIFFIIFQKLLDSGTHRVHSKRGQKCYRMSFLLFSLMYFLVLFLIIFY